MAACEHLAVQRAERKARRPGFGDDSCLRGFERRRRAGETIDPVAFDAHVARLAQRGEAFAAEGEHRDRAAEHLLGDEYAEGEDVVDLFQQQGGRGMAVEDQFQHHAAAGAGAAAAGNRQHAAADDGAAERVVTVDDFAAEGVDAAPETQAEIGMQQLALRRSGHQGAAA